jgi:DNA-binding IclR family transcriptional regulator
MGDGSQRLSVMERTFEIIEYIQEVGTVRVKDVAEVFDIPTSTAHVYLKTLRECGYAVQTDDGYKLSFRFLEIGGRLQWRNKLYDITRPIVRDLAVETGEHVALGVHEDGWRVILHRRDGQQAVHDNDQLGNFEYMHLSALGLAMLAFMPEDEVETICAAHGLPKIMENSIHTERQLWDRIETIRARGYAIEDEERHEGVRSVAAPILINGSPWGALAIKGPVARFSDHRIGELVEHLREKINLAQMEIVYY